MSAIRLSEAVFRLGEIGADPTLTPQSALDRMIEVAAHAVEVDVIGAVVYEQGLLSPATYASIRGPWTSNETARFMEQSRWDLEDRVLAQQLLRLPIGRLYRRDDLVPHTEFCRSKLYNEFLRPLGLGDQSVALFHRADGVEILFGINVVDSRGPLPRATIARASALAPFMNRSWERCWRREPEWAAGIKPSSRAVLDLVLEGLDDHQIAERTGMTYHSVRACLKRLFQRAGVRSRLHLMQVYRSPNAVSITDQPLDAERQTA